MLLYVTCRDSKEAEKLSNALLKQKLIACSNMIRIESMYSWKGKIERSSEILIIAKTSKKNTKKAEALIKKLHSYEVPAIIRIESKSSKEFEKWSDSVMK
jgi:periplasmic divalent cation tolerance protein